MRRVSNLLWITMAGVLRIAAIQVAGAAKGADIESVSASGADQVVDYDAGPFEQRISPVDVVLDVIGGEIQERSLKVLRKGGILVSTVGINVASEAKARGIEAKEFWVRSDGDQLSEISRLIDAGRLSSCRYRAPARQSEGGARARRVRAGQGKSRAQGEGLTGDWTMKKQFTLLNQATGRIAYRFQARDLHLVMGLAPRGNSTRFRMLIDGEPPGDRHGSDVDNQGNGRVTEQGL